MLRHERQHQDIGSHLRQDIQNFNFSGLSGSSEINIRPIGNKFKGGGDKFGTTVQVSKPTMIEAVLFFVANNLTSLRFG